MQLAHGHRKADQVMHLSYKLQGKQRDATHTYRSTSVILSSDEARDVLKTQPFGLTRRFESMGYVPGRSAYLHVDCRGRGVRQEQHHEEERVRSGKDTPPMCQDYHSSPCSFPRCECIDWLIGVEMHEWMDEWSDTGMYWLID